MEIFEKILKVILIKNHHLDFDKKNFNLLDTIKLQSIRILITKIFTKKKGNYEREDSNPLCLQSTLNQSKKIQEEITTEEITTINIEIDINELDFSIHICNITKDFNTKVEGQDLTITNLFILKTILEGIIESTGIDKIIKKVY